MRRRNRTVVLPTTGVEATRSYFASRRLALEGVAPETPLLASLTDPVAPLGYSALHESFTCFVRLAVKGARPGT